MPAQNLVNTFAAKLVEYRTTHRLSQEQMAKKLHTTRNKIANIESRRSTPDIAIVYFFEALVSSSIYQLCKPV